MAEDHSYKKELRRLQIGLVRYQQWAVETGDKALVIFEGRDGAGKDGTIARITAHLAPRNTRVVSLPKPSERDRSEWYFQRYVRHLPACGEFVLFNRSWYNRAGVEPVMGFCTPEEHRLFLREAARLDARETDPLKHLKISDLDRVAQTKWKDYSKARDEMLLATNTTHAPWTCVRANHKKPARLNVIRFMLHALAPKNVRRGIERPDPEVLFAFEKSALSDGRLER